ncbi:MAG TPA: intradiol ring-cleavage dioxygenase [Noviherbaspirillum sp.]|uniref:intradiol ring-cleavage dioxygenase n=1 Tax=Noviherbaspirillum sp. TaxID=1926288 RepID=UPI002D6AE799|nr:intradiol ring-cleavage dioxygenase [Noviherbaspirillum sp.]HYD93836.1 intradiol ring-cleavage dioxygenase [Noviherbaspirillum sp.]
MNRKPVPKTGVSRRDALLALGAALVAGPASSQLAAPRPACILTPEQMEGPYFSDVRLDRSDIRGDPSDGSVKPGVPLALSLRVLAVTPGNCAPLAGAVVDLWHCDASGAYSDATDSGFQTRGRKFLRGYQTTDAAGAVRFFTIYPGWYPGRAVHVHFKVRSDLLQGREFSSQLYFPNALTERVHARSPYERTRGRGTRNESDGLFRNGGTQLLLDPKPTSDGGYMASFDVGVALA